MNFKYKDSTNNNFAVNLLLVMISAVLSFMGAKIFGAKAAVVVYAIAIAVCFYKTAIEAIEKLINGKIHYTLIYLASVLVIFASQKFLMAAVVAIVISLSTAIYELINYFLSKKLLEDDENKLKYDVLVDESTVKSVYAEDLLKDDIVKVNKNDFLAFNYIYTDANGTEKKYSAGKFMVDVEEAFVKVESLVEYEIDFAETEKDKNSKVFKITSMVSNVYTIVMVAVAIVMFALEFIQSKAMLQSLYVLGIYLLFANPLVINSGIFTAGLLSLKELKSKGVNLMGVSELETISNVKKVYFDNELALENETKPNEKVIKAVKIADVLNIETQLLSDKDDEISAVYAKTMGFKNVTSEVLEDMIAEVVDTPLKKGVCAYVTSKEIETQRAVVISTEGKDNSVCKCKLGEFIKAIKYAKIFSWFSYARVAVGALVNTAVFAVFASGKGAQILANKLVETDVTTLKGKILTALVQYEILTPWIISAVSLVLVNVLLFVTLAFLTDDEK